MNLRQTAGAAIGTLLAVAATVTVGSAGTDPATAAGAQAPSTGNHFVTNLQGAVSAPRRIGFTLFDTSASVEQVSALPSGVRAVVWLGQKCPTGADDAFRAQVRRLADLRKVFGYYLSDEPHIADCPGGPAALASRADFIRQASSGQQKSFVVLSKIEDFRPFRPAVTRVDMVGLDPYPCSVANPQCDISKIDERVNAAIAAGIPRRQIVPTYQAFGQQNVSDGYYNLPSVAQMRAMVARWARLVPQPPMDYTYGWGNQGSANPTLKDSVGLRALFRGYFR